METFYNICNHHNKTKTTLKKGKMKISLKVCNVNLWGSKQCIYYKSLENLQKINQGFVYNVTNRRRHHFLTMIY